MTSPRATRDLKKDLDCDRAPRGHFRIVDVPRRRHLMIDGHGDANTSDSFADAVAALHPIACGVKFASKTELGRDYVVMPGGTVVARRYAEAFTAARDTSRWDWTPMIMTPERIGTDLVESVVQRTGARNPAARLGDVRFQAMTECPCVQILHVGPFDAEAAVQHTMLRRPVVAVADSPRDGCSTPR